MLPFLIDKNDTATMQKALESGAFDAILRNSIDSYIEYAIEQQALELQILLTNYKHEKIGYTDPAERMKL